MDEKYFDHLLDPIRVYSALITLGSYIVAYTLQS